MQMTESPTRRGLFAALLPPQTPAHISSAVVSVLPAQRQQVLDRLAQTQGVEVHHTGASKLVVVLEGDTSGALGAMLADISGWPGVLSANMVFEQQL
jgi:nitrate reductase NapD